jgi:hypothetical protein
MMSGTGFLGSDFDYNNEADLSSSAAKILKGGMLKRDSYY